MKTNRIFQVCAVFLCLNIAYQNQTKASHAVGSDLTYTCLGGNNYEVSLAFYRDCSGANAPNSPTVTISSQTCGFTGANDIDVKLNLEPGYPVDVTPVCGAIQTDCVPGANGYRGVEKRVYKGLVTLPQSCTDWVFSYRICCRNPAITNIQNPGGQGMYVEATLDNLNAPCNSSSTFSNDPVPYACINKQFCFNQGSQDPDGDLLTYTLIDPKTDNAGGTVTYSPGFSAVSPVSLPPGSAFNIDPNTGDICFISNAIEVTVLAVLVEEWRGGIKIGSTIRDIQLNTIACNNDNPEPGDIFGNSAASGAFSEVVCAGSPVVFTIQGFDPDINDQLTMTWNNGIPAGNWNVVNQGTNNPTATFTWNPTAADISAVPYTFTVSIEDDACPIKGTFTRAYSVTVQGINVDAGLDENPAACGLTYARNAVAVGGTPPYLFEWSDGTVGAAINNMECGKYYVTVTDANGCEGIDSVSIKCPDIQIIAANITPESCYGDCDGEVQLAVNGGAAPYNYAWSNNVANGDLAVGLCAGSHWVTVTDQGGCSDSLESKIIAGDIVPNLFLTSDDSLCEGAASIPLGTNYPGGAWSGNGVNNAVNPSEFDPVVAGPGIHNVTYTLVMPNGICQTQQNMPIEVLDIDITPVVIEPLCNGGNDGIVNLTDNNNNITDFHFFNGVFATVQGNGQFGGLTAGNYTITGADIGSKFCPTNIPVVVTEPQALANVMAAADISCFGLCDGNIIANPAGGTPPYAYSWNTAQNSANLINLCAGNYSVTITDDNGCNLVDNGNIVEPADFNIQEVIVNANCDKYDGSITLNVGGAAGGFVYQWDNAAVTANLNNVDSGTYVVTITDANNCAKVHNVIVPANPGPSVNVVSSMTTCYGDCDGTATAVGNGGTTPGQYTYAWSNGQLVSVANGLCAGNYTVTVFDGNNCSFETNIAVSEPSQVRVAIDHYPDTTICIGGTASFTATAEGGSGQGFTYTWDNGWVGPGQHDDLPAVPTCYTVTAFDDNNCPSLPLTSCVDFYDPLQVVAFDDVTICEGSDVHLSAMTFGGNPNNNVTYSWDGGQGIGANYTTAPAGSFPNNLQIQVVASDGCSPDAVDFVTVDFYPNPVPYFTPDVSEICPGEELLFENLSVPGSFIACHWDFGDGNVSNDCELQQTVSYSEPGVYNIALSLFSQHGCVGTSTGSVTVHPNPVADFSTTSPGNLQDMNVGFQDQSIGNIDDWHWTLFDNVDNSIVLDTLNDNQFFFDYALFGSQDLYAMQDTGYYPVHLEVTTVHGCSADTLKHIKIDGIDFINIPNAFSPNGDARNDEFFPVALGIDPYDDYEFLIFNRWGDLIFRGDDLYETWKGSTTEMTDNEEAQQGVYVWTLQYRTLDGQLKNEMGHVTLLR